MIRQRPASSTAQRHAGRANGPIGAGEPFERPPEATPEPGSRVAQASNKHGRAAHARARGARAPRPKVAARALLVLLALGVMPWSASAQVQGLEKSDLPAPNSTDREIDPFPFDARLAIRSYFRERLPTYWWANEPEYNLGRFSVTIHVPDMWRGNPTSALMALCPQPHSYVWTGVKEIELKAMYRKAPWPGTTCRP